MEKISVIIPTIQKNIKVLESLLSSLLTDEVVGEILIINNAERMLVIPSDKVRVLNQKENIFVNASWNLGVELVGNDIFLILNDDILPCENFCSKIYNSGILNNESTGLIGLDNSFIKNVPRSTKLLNKPEGLGEPCFTELSNYFNTGDWGSAFFGRKQNYYRIPEELKIIFGDNYLLYKNLKNGKKNYSIGNLYFNHIHSLSSASPEFREIVKNDMDNYKKYFTN